MTVPAQDLAKWYPETGWIAAGKERIARTLAAKYELSLCEPPDESSGFLFPRGDARNNHHHLEWTNPVETVLVAHPRYLKVRLFGAVPSARYAGNVRSPLGLGPDLLADLSSLYRE